MKNFSQRKGLKPVSELIQLESMSDELRISLWNALDLSLWSTRDFLYSEYREPHIELFSQLLWFSYFKQPIDRRPTDRRKILSDIRSYFFNCTWNEVYDFLEAVVSIEPILGRDRANSRTQLHVKDVINMVLEQELSAYRIISGKVVDVTDAQEVAMLDEATRDTEFVGVTKHLQRALELYADRDSPDYRNSIKESISAVESMARIVADKPKTTLGDALKVIAAQGTMHPALREGFQKLYGYTSDEQGIRHAMLDEPKITAADAKYFLLSCTSFVNYLKAQIS